LSWHSTCVFISVLGTAMRIPVVGVGPVSCYFGGLLAHAGEDVVFTRGARLRAIRNHGLQIDDGRDKFVVNSARATGDPSSVGPAGTILVGVKAWQNRGRVRNPAAFAAGEHIGCGAHRRVDAPYRFPSFSTRRVAAERRARGEILFHSRRETFPRLHEFRRL
jgi:hypothetical protein